MPSCFSQLARRGSDLLRGLAVGAALCGGWGVLHAVPASDRGLEWVGGYQSSECRPWKMSQPFVGTLFAPNPNECAYVESDIVEMAQWLATQPPVQSLVIPAVSMLVEAAVRLPHLSRLYLYQGTLSADVWESSVVALAQKPAMYEVGLLQVEISGKKSPLALLNQLMGVRSLILLNMGIRDQDLPALQPIIARLHVLNLHGNQITEAGIRTLAQFHAPLVGLDVSANPLGRRSISIISQDFPHLQELTLNQVGTRLTKADIQALGDHGPWAVLRLNNNQLDQEAARLLAASRAMAPHAAYRHMELNDNAISLEGLRALRKAQGLHGRMYRQEYGYYPFDLELRNNPGCPATDASSVEESDRFICKITSALSAISYL